MKSPFPGEHHVFANANDPLATIVKGVMDWSSGCQALKPRGPVDIVISPSQLSAYSTCRLKWWLRYVAKAPAKPKLSLRWGSAMHKIIEQYNLGANPSQLFEVDETGNSPAYNTAVDYLEAVEGINLHSEATAVAETCARYIKANPNRLDMPEEDHTVYLFTLVLHGLAPESWPRVFLRGITDAKMIRRQTGGEGDEEWNKLVTTLVDYKSSGRRWDRGRTDREPAPSFYALREYLLANAPQNEYDLVHEVVLKVSPKCKGCKGKDADGCGYVDEYSLETCVGGYSYGQRFITTRGREHMERVVAEIVQFAFSRTTTGNELPMHPPSPGYDQMNCNMCDYREQCTYHGAESIELTIEQRGEWPPWGSTSGRLMP